MYFMFKVFKFVMIATKHIIGIYTFLKHHKTHNLAHVAKLLVQCSHHNEGKKPRTF